MIYSQFLAKAVAMEKFRKGRQPSDVELTVETADGPVRARIVDVNEYGMRLFGAMTVRRGEDLTASLDSWDISGVIRWARTPYCGVQFDSRAPETAVAEMRGLDGHTPPPLAKRVKTRQLSRTVPRPYS